MKTFEARKKHVLQKMLAADKSKKGSIDKPIQSLLDTINNDPEWYTTSSCSGRIVILHEPESKKKNEYEWTYVTHTTADPEDVIQAAHTLTDNPGTGWLRMQTAIIHVACKDLAAAERLLNHFYRHGWKRSGIFSNTHDTMVELLSVEHIDAPIMHEGNILVNDDYLRAVTTLANEKLATTHKKLLLAEKRLRETHTNV